MSRIGKKPIELPKGVSANLSGNVISIKGPLGEDKLEIMENIIVKQNDNILAVELMNESTDKKLVAFQGLFRSLVNNMIIGVSQGFEKDLEIIGVGYRAQQDSKNVVFQLGYSHNITFSPPNGITVQVEDTTKIKVKGINKQQVGQVAADIRKFRPPEPYKGKGIRYKDEYVRKKAGKAGK